MRPGNFHYADSNKPSSAHQLASGRRSTGPSGGRRSASGAGPVVVLVVEVVVVADVVDDEGVVVGVVVFVPASRRSREQLDRRGDVGLRQPDLLAVGREIVLRRARRRPRSNSFCALARRLATVSVVGGGPSGRRSRWSARSSCPPRTASLIASGIDVAKHGVLAVGDRDVLEARERGALGRRDVDRTDVQDRVADRDELHVAAHHRGSVLVEQRQRLRDRRCSSRCSSRPSTETGCPGCRECRRARAARSSARRSAPR